MNSVQTRLNTSIKLIAVMLALILLLPFARLPYTYTAYAAGIPSGWAVDIVARARTANLTTDKTTADYQRLITREEFAELSLKLYEKIRNVHFDLTTQKFEDVFEDTKNKSVLMTWELGLVSGYIANDGRKIFHPDGKISREQIAVMLHNVIKKAVPIEITVPTVNFNRFTDASTVSSWALESVTFVTAAGIMTGTGGALSPQSYTTCEQAITLILKAYEYIGSLLKPENQTAVKVGSKEVRLWESEEKVLKTFGEPNEKLYSGYCFTWYVYNSDYQNFIMIGIADGLVRGISTNASFTYGNSKKGGAPPKENDVNGVYYIIDNPGGNIIDGILITGISPFEYEYYNKNKDSILAADEKVIFYFTNAMRVYNGLLPLEYDEKLQKVARAHSKNMAANNFFDHTDLAGKTPHQRMTASISNLSATAENIACGSPDGILTYEQWLNSPSHRSAMLSGKYTNLGVGAAFNRSSDGWYYYTQNFCSYFD